MNAVEAVTLAANCAVVVSLVLVMVQTRHNRTTTRALADRAQTNEVNSFFLTLASDPTLAMVWMRGRREPERLSVDERAQFFYLCVTWFLHHETTFRQKATDLASGEYVESWLRALQADVAMPGIQAYWVMEREFYDKEFRAQIDRFVTDPGAVVPLLPRGFPSSTR
jgi:hypothetical protein